MSLRQQGAKATKWTAASMLFTTCVQFVQLIVLSRMLTPEDYGIMSMVMVVVGVAVALGDMGVTGVVFHKQELTGEQLSGIYLLNLISGVVVFALFVLCTPVMAILFQEPRLLLPLYMVSSIFLLMPIGQLYQALLQKEVRFHTIALMEIVSSATAFIIAIMLARSGYGVYALVWSQIILNGLKAAISFAAGFGRWKIRISFHCKELKAYIRFGSYQMGEKIIHFISTNIDYILIGRFFGAEVLGLYSFACNLVIVPVIKINPVLSQVALPLLAKIRDSKERLKSGYYQTLRMLSMVNAPIYAGLIAASPYLVPLIFGQKWAPAVIYVQILSAMGFFRSMISPVNALLVAIGRVDLGFKWTVTLMAVMLPVISAGAYFGGTMGIAIACVILQIGFYLLKYAWIMRRLFDTSLAEYVSIAAPSAGISALMGAAVAAVPLLRVNLVPSVTLAAQIVLGVILYTAFNWQFNRASLAYIGQSIAFRGRGRENDLPG